MSYNGWSNYESWRVNLELFDGYDPMDGWDPSDSFDGKPDVDELAAHLESVADELVLEPVPEGLARDLAAQFLAKVDWKEIAGHMLENYWPEYDRFEVL